MDMPLLEILFFLPIFGVIFLWILVPARFCFLFSTVISLLTLLTSLFVVENFDSTKTGFQMLVQMDWISDLGIHFLLGVDGISLFFLPTTAFLFFSVLVASKFPQIKVESENSRKTYYSLLLLLETLTLGIFCALDTIFFFFCWEFTLIPLFFLIQGWGTGKNRHHAAVQYVLLILSGGAFLLFGFLLLGFQEKWIFDFPTLLTHSFSADTETIVFFLFLIGFGMKVPLPPFHTWLPLVSTEGPIPIVALLTGLKLGAYGFIRFLIPLVPHAAHEFHWLLAGFGATGLVLGALVALAQTDARRMLAYASISHVGLVVLGIASFNIFGLQGAVFQLLNFAFASGGAFLLLSFLQVRMGSTDSQHLSGLAKILPILSGFFLFLGFTSLGMPGTSGFPGEWLILIGMFKSHVGAGLTALFILVVSAAYFLGLYRHLFFGSSSELVGREWIDLRPRELGIALLFSMIVLVTGLFPSWILHTMQVSSKEWVEHVNQK
ncbi:NADH dehydrogenase I subunit M [Gammaproteobacteria bacterium]